MKKSPLLLLIDGHSLAFRAYYALAKSKMGPLRTSTGIPTSITFGFLNSLVQVIDREKPQSLAIAFDLPKKTFRHQADENYKANRPEVPEDFVTDLGNLQDLLLALNLQILTAPGYEADDVLATVAKQGSEAGYQVKIISGDRDLFQLVDSTQKISVLYLPGNAMRGSSSTKFEEFQEAEVEQKLKVKPNQVIDYKALCGDSSDNIPGVRGIGEKTAAKLLKEYQTLENIYQNIDNIKGAVKKKLKEGKKDADWAKYLVTIISDVPIEFSLPSFQLKGFDFAKVKEIFAKLELNKFLKELNSLQQKLGGNLEAIREKESSSTQQLSLFDDNSPSEPKIDSEEVSVTEPSFLKPEIIDTTAKLTALIERLETYIDPQFPVAWDTETTGLNPLDAELVGIGCCWGTKPTNVAYIPIFHQEGTTLSKKQVFDALRPILENSQYPKAFQNTKFDRLILLNQGINLAGVVFDTMLASYALHPEEKHNLKALSQRYLSGIASKSYSELEIPKGKTIADLAITKVADYCALDAYATFCLVTKLQEELEAVPKLKKLFLEIENPLEIVLSEMENQGIQIDIPYLEKFSQQLSKTLTNLEAKAYQDAGQKFNLSSPKQLSQLLFETLQLDLKKTRKTKTGYSTNHATLEKLQGDHPVIDHILEHRTLAKLKSTYVDTLPALVHPKTQRVHTDFNQAVTSTGRLSSSNPNLQNIPIRTEFSRQIRKAFLPQEGWSLVAADYSQIELRILAHLSQEPVLVEAYQKNQDVHTVTAQVLLEKENITPAERRLGKTINFGVIYGMGAQRFAREAGVSSKEGKAFIEKYRQRYGKIFQYLERMKKEAIAQGYVKTLYNRRRYFHFNSSRLRQLKGSNPEAIDLDNLKNLGQIDAQLLRAAANAPIQGSSADIIKIAMVKLHKILQPYQGRLLLQVHDELIFEVPPDEQSELTGKIKDVMENAVNLTVPLWVEIHSGKNWMEAK